ncbi:MAG: 16S rRNA (uracil(1498)-N(3))-methyltransferase [Thermodesulfobacteria bacterium]|nr:16S rRNA (uracil(1498)-N(3))-methyltransferase [Thermodesulfobacteriota bacterium]
MGASELQKALARFLAPGAKLGEPYLLSREESHHLREVLRLKEGAAVKLLDLQGREFLGRVEKLGREVLVRPEELLRAATPPDFEVSALIPLLKKENLAFLVEKATELGITRIIPYSSSRTIVKPKKNLREKLERRALQSLKQCGRLWPLEIFDPLSLEEAAQIEAELKVVAYEGEKKTPLKPLFENFSGKSLLLASGPEGGFSQEEIDLLKEKGFLRASLGPLILRAETAAFYLMCTAHLFFFAKS